ncbi:MAG: LysR family transcriptional regulator [Bradymonadia bacterium]
MLDGLYHMILVETLGTFTAAAEAAHLSQPALTASIQRLESHFGARLFHRGRGLRGGARLTPAGKALLPYARRIHATLADGERAVAELLGQVAGTVRLAAGATACTYLLPEILARFRNAHPGITLQVQECSTGTILKLLEAGEIDLGVVTGPGVERWRSDDLVLVAGPGSPYVALTDPEAMAQAPMVTFAEGSPLREMALSTFPEAQVVMSLSNIAAVKGNVRAGIGVALVSEAAVAHDLAARRLVRLAHPATPIPRLLSLVHRGVEHLPPAASSLREMLLEGI